MIKIMSNQSKENDRNNTISSVERYGTSYFTVHCAIKLPGLLQFHVIAPLYKVLVILPKIANPADGLAIHDVSIDSHRCWLYVGR